MCLLQIPGAFGKEHTLSGSRLLSRLSQVPLWPPPGYGSGTSRSLMTPQGMSEGGECSLQTAESTASAVSTWHLKQERRGCTLSRLQERESVYFSHTLQSDSEG